MGAARSALSENPLNSPIATPLYPLHPAVLYLRAHNPVTHNAMARVHLWPQSWGPAGSSPGPLYGLHKYLNSLSSFPHITDVLPLKHTILSSAMPGKGFTRGHKVGVLQAPVHALYALVAMRLGHLEAGGGAGARVPEQQGAVIPHAGQLVAGGGAKDQVSNHLLVPLRFTGTHNHACLVPLVPSSAP